MKIKEKIVYRASRTYFNFFFHSFSLLSFIRRPIFKSPMRGQSSRHRAPLSWDRWDTNERRPLRTIVCPALVNLSDLRKSSSATARLYVFKIWTFFYSSEQARTRFKIRHSSIFSFVWCPLLTPHETIQGLFLTWNTGKNRVQMRQGRQLRTKERLN